VAADLDQSDLSRYGYAQELFRAMGGFSNFAISFSVISILTGAVTLYGYGLARGGPREMAAGWPIVAFFSLAVAASMGELASAFPTSGGMYHWSARLGGPAWGWFTAWFNILGLIATLAGIDYGCAKFAAPLLGLPAGSWQLLTLYGAILVSHALINQYGIRLVAILNDLSVTVHIAGVVLIAGALFWFAPKQPVSFFFQVASAPSTVHSSYAWLFLIGLLQAQWTFTGFDASAHTAEETHDPRRRAPWGIVLSVAVSAVVGYVLLFALTLAIRDLPAMLQAGANDEPVPILILTSALGARAGASMSWLAVVAMWFCGLSTITSISRTIFSLARDGGMPAFLRRVNATHHTPGPAIWAAAVTAFAALVYSGAYSVVTSISVVMLFISYVLPVALALRAERHTDRTDLRGPWHLGRFSTPIRVTAIAWTVFISVVMVMPPNELAGKSLGMVVVALALIYIFRVQKTYRGPEWAQSPERVQRTTA
jgi:amino acid transporter